MAFNSFHLALPPAVDLPPRLAVEKITDTFLGEDSKIYYKVRWQETWEPEEKMMLMCAHIVNDFWKEYYAKSQKQQSSGKTNFGNDQIESMQLTSDKSVSKDVMLPDQRIQSNSLFEMGRIEHSAIQTEKQPDTTMNGSNVQKTLCSTNHDTNEAIQRTLIKLNNNNNLQNVNGINNLNEPLPSFPSFQFTANMGHKKNMPVFIQPRLTNHHLLNPNFVPLLSQSSSDVSTPIPPNSIVQHTKSKLKKCEICSTEFEDASSLKKHVRTDHAETVELNCNICNKLLKTSTALKRHMLTHVTSKPHTCPECGKGFKEKSNMTKHMVIHTGARPFSCDVCSARFRQLGHLLKHVLIHKPDKPFNCDQCLKSFRRKEHLKEHQVIHTGTFPFQCHICDKKFNFRANLKNHVTQHDGNKNFVCHICSKAFSGKANLTQHLLVHTETLKYTCDICQKQFKRDSHLRKHKLSHTLRKELSCDLCNNTFQSKEEFHKHLLKHIGPKPFSCDLCSKKFSTQVKLTNHKKRHKNIDPIDSNHQGTGNVIENNQLITSIFENGSNGVNGRNCDDLSVEQSKVLKS